MSKIVERTLDVLEMFAGQRRPMTLTDIARYLAIPVSSVHDVLRAMVSRGYLYELSPRGGYYPTLRICDMALAIRAADPIVLRAEAVLQELQVSLDETVVLGRVSGLDAMALLVLDPSRALAVRYRVGDRSHALSGTSAGKALLGSLSPEALMDALEQQAPQPKNGRILRATEQLRHDIDEGNALGWFLDSDDTVQGVTTISARVAWDFTVYIVTIAGPTARMQPLLDQAVELLKTACNTLEMRPRL